MSEDAHPVDTRTALGQASSRLREAGIATHQRDAEVLIGAALGMTRAQLIIRDRDPVGADAQLMIARFIEQRCDHEPVAYILGAREFWSMRFEVTPDVLIPRPETECLVEASLRYLASDVPVRVLDIGTGSGAIAAAIASERPASQVVATDLSEAALLLAKRNIQRLGLGEQVRFLLGDLFEPLDRDECFDLVISNPPYVATREATTLMPEVRDHEPAVALFAGADGLGVIRAVIEGARAFLSPRGLLAIEHGADQGPGVCELMTNQGFAPVQPGQDYAGHDRFALAFL